ncbi:hypothetical protein BH20ACI2_BH20ACI2_28830 [soil metagenome]
MNYFKSRLDNARKKIRRLPEPETQKKKLKKRIADGFWAVRDPFLDLGEERSFSTD